MDDILDVLVAHGVPSATIVRVAKLIADARVTEQLRDSARERMRRVRERSRKHPNTAEHDPALSLEVSKIKDLKKETRRKAKTPLPADWQPIGPQRDTSEPDEFRDHAKAKGYQYSDWHAAYRNFQRSPFNARNKPGAAPQAAQSCKLAYAASWEERSRKQLEEREAMERGRR